MKIDVTQQWIDLGIQSDCNSCPIALAVRVALSHDGVPIEISVAEKDILVKEFGSASVIYDLPDEAKRFINLFDSVLNRSLLKPFSFELGEPEELKEFV